MVYPAAMTVRGKGVDVHTSLIRSLRITRQRHSSTQALLQHSLTLITLQACPIHTTSIYKICLNTAKKLPELLFLHYRSLNLIFSDSNNINWRFNVEVMLSANPGKVTEKKNQLCLLIMVSLLH